MKGDILLLAHLAAFDEPEPGEEGPSGTERLEAAVGPVLAHALLAALAPARARADA